MLQGSRFIFILILEIATKITTSVSECVDGPSIWYEGTRSYTKSGTPCQRWDSDTPHKPLFVPADGGNHTYCRNPDHDQSGTWCYTTNPEVKWEYCNIPKCPDDSIVAWGSYDTDLKSAKIVSFEADPEMVMQRKTADQSSVLSTTNYKSDRIPSQITAMASDYNEQKIFFVDAGGLDFGVHNLKSGTTSYYLQGMAVSIEGLAYDWATKNLYWTDSFRNWVMVSSDNFKLYAPVYKTTSKPLAITVHASKRRLFVSLYKPLGSKLISTNLAGGDVNELFTFPEVITVGGMTIDYTEDKLYWSDFTGFASSIYSSDLNGSNKTRLYFSTSSKLWDIASHMNYIYATDARTRFLADGNRYYLWWISKTRTTNNKLKIGNYRLEQKPRGVTVMSKSEEFSLDANEEVGSCTSVFSTACQHICLPMVGRPRQCACSIGYELIDGSRCVANVDDSDRIIVADIGQSKIFQMKLPESRGKVVAVPHSSGLKPYAVDVSVSSNQMYISDVDSKTIVRSSWDGQYAVTIATNKTVRTLAVDPRLQLIFYADIHSQFIYVTQHSGLYTKAIMKTPSETSNIGKIALDFQTRTVYWCDKHDSDGKGQVLSMKYDGSEKKVLLDKLNSPEAITVDQEGRRLFVADSLGMIYEYSMDTVESLNGDVTAKNKTWLGVGTGGSPFQISEIKVSGSHLYLFDQATKRIERFYLKVTTDQMSVQAYGPDLFYEIYSFAIYSKDLNYYTKNLKNPCQSRFEPCRHICVALTDTESTCLCNDGYEINALTDCVPVNLPDVTPPEPMNCPSDITSKVGPCQDSTIFPRQDIIWADDQTENSKLQLNNPDQPNILIKIGKTVIRYSATDEAGNVGECVFTVTLEQEKCSVPSIDNRVFNPSSAYCADGIRYLDVSCRSVGYRVTIPGSTRTNDTLTLECQALGVWIPSVGDLSCVPGLTAADLSDDEETSAVINPPSTQSTTLQQQVLTDPASIKPLAISSSTNNQLSTGVIAAIAVAAFVVLCVALVLGVYLWQRRTGKTAITFPVFWKSKEEDNSTLETNEVGGSHSYSVFNR